MKALKFSKTVKAALAGVAVTGLALTLGACSTGTETTEETAASSAPIPMEADGDITWYTWEGFVAPEIVESFETEYGVTVNFEYFDSEETMLQRLASGAEYDLINGSSAHMQRTLDAGLVQPLNWEEIDTSDLLPYFQEPWYDNGEVRYTAPYGAGPTGFLYKPAVITNNTDSWEAFWSNPQASGRITVLPQQVETIGMSLVNLGYDLNSDDPAEVEEAVDALLEIKPDLAAMSNDTVNDVLQDRADLIQTWTGSAYSAMTQVENPEEWSFTIPQDQTPLGTNLLMVGANAKAPGTAQLMIDWLLRPENSAANTEWSGYYFGTNASAAKMEELTADFPFLSIPDDFWETAKWKVSATGERLDLWTEQWNRFRA